MAKIRQMIGEIVRNSSVGEEKCFLDFSKIFLDNGKVLATVCYMFFPKSAPFSSSLLKSNSDSSWKNKKT